MIKERQKMKRMSNDWESQIIKMKVGLWERGSNRIKTREKIFKSKKKKKIFYAHLKCKNCKLL